MLFRLMSTIMVECLLHVYASDIDLNPSLTDRLPGHHPLPADITQNRDQGSQVRQEKIIGLPKYPQFPVHSVQDESNSSRGEHGGLSEQQDEVKGIRCFANQKHVGRASAHPENGGRIAKSLM